MKVTLDTWAKRVSHQALVHVDWRVPRVLWKSQGSCWGRDRPRDLKDLNFRSLVLNFVRRGPQGRELDTLVRFFWEVCQGGTFLQVQGWCSPCPSFSRPFCGPNRKVKNDVFWHCDPGPCGYERDSQGYLFCRTLHFSGRDVSPQTPAQFPLISSDRQEPVRRLGVS